MQTRRRQSAYHCGAPGLRYTWTMPMFSFEGQSPTIAPTAFVAPTATVIGDVTIEAGASVWFNTVLRADYAPVIVREGANVQDGSVLHAAPGIPVDVGPGATVAHMCLIHGVHVGPEALIANHATVLDGVVIGSRSLIAAHSLVVAGTHIPAEVLVVGSPATVKGPIGGTSAETWVNVNPQAYQGLARRYLTGLEPI
jgi:carbonic anhydrase/acetyltransferase-like protein (isoleucine patch superfamily)